MKSNEKISANSSNGVSSSGQTLARDVMGECVMFLKKEEGGGA